MGNNELLIKLELIRALEAQQYELQEQIDALKDCVKAEMAARGVDKLSVGTYRVAWTKFTSHRFDTNAFRAEHKDIYDKYVREVEATRFTVK